MIYNIYIITKFEVKPTMLCPRCGKEREENQKFCTNCGYCFEHTTLQLFDMPMKWYKFLVLIVLPVSIFSNFINGISYIVNPGVSSADISGLGDVSRSALEKLNVFTGICMLIIAIFMIYTLKALRGFRKNSLMCVVSVYVFNAIVNIVNSGLMYYILGKQAQLAIEMLVGINITVAAVMIVANVVYFNKRKHIFVN